MSDSRQYADALEKLDGIHGRLEALRGHDEIDGYAAEDYIDEAQRSIEAAISDVREGRDER